MEPSIKKGDILEVDKNAYRAIKPRRWDVVLFESPRGSGSEWVMRIVGIPGEKIDFSKTGVTINGHPAAIPENLKTKHVPPIQETKGFVVAVGLNLIDFPYTVPEDCYFVMGDNQKESLDSRYWGGLNFRMLRGKITGVIPQR